MRPQVWDNDSLRDMTPEEAAQYDIDQRVSASVRAKEHNAAIKVQLESIDIRTVRPLREGDTERVQALNAEAAALRTQLVPE